MPELEKIIETMADAMNATVKLELVLKPDHAIEVIRFVSQLLSRK